MAVGVDKASLSNQLLAVQAASRSPNGLTASLDLAGSHTRGQPVAGMAMSLSLGRETPHMQLGVNAGRTGHHFFPADGFIPGHELGTIGWTGDSIYIAVYARRVMLARRL